MVDLYHPYVLGAEVAGQAGAVGAGALDPDRPYPAEGAQPVQQVGVTGLGGGELSVGDPTTVGQDDRGVVGVGVGVHPGDDRPFLRFLGWCVVCHPGWVAFLRSRVG